MSTACSVTPFLFDGEIVVRVILREGLPWFVAVDVCQAVGIEKHRDAISRLDPDERGSVKVDTPGGPQDMAAINESGLYTLILRCRDALKPGTIPHRFRKWVTSEVLPSIRRTGAYDSALAAEPPMRDFPDWPAEELRVRKGTADLYRKVYGPLAAQWIMPRLGFPVPPRTLIAIGRQVDLFEILVVETGR